MRVLFAALIVLLVVPLHGAEMVLRGATVYPAPEAEPVRDATVIVRDGRIVRIGPGASTEVDADATVLDGTGKFIVAGFWNCHVHILAPSLLQARDAPAATLNQQLDAMFNRWGFTHVFDLASGLDNTLALRSRIEAGELRGPAILTVGEPLWTHAPIYVQDFLAEHQIRIPDVQTPEEAVAQIAHLSGRGVAGIKLFTGSVQARGVVANMSAEFVRAACAEAHRRGLPVFAHAQNTAGLEAALDGGVDILAHVTPQTAAWTPALVERMRRAHMALIPTLTLFDSEGRKDGLPDATIESWLESMTDELRVFSGAGGEVLFGTDIGYIDHYNTELEFRLMARAGLDFPKILAALTTAPAARFGSPTDAGRIAVGMEADLVVLDADPVADITGLAKVHMTIRQGRVIYSAP